MKLTKLFLLLASISALVIASDSAVAAPATSAKTGLTVTATVVKSCSITTSTVAFGEYDPLSVAVNATGSVSVTCSKGSGTSVALDYGASAGAGTQPRMTDGTNFLNYNLYSDAARSKLWNGTSVAILPATAIVPTPQVLTVYGQIPGLQNVQPGSYTDTVQATVNF